MAAGDTLPPLGALYVQEVSAPSTPASGTMVIYAKSDGKLYAKNDAGTEFDLTAGGASAMTPPTELVGVYSSGSTVMGVAASSNVTNDAGDLTADAWKTVVSLTTSGVIQLCGVRQNSTTNQQVGIRITIDGVQVLSFDNVPSSQSTSGVVAIGWIPTANSTFGSEAVPFNSSFQLEVRSSVNRTAGTSVQYLLKYYTT